MTTYDADGITLERVREHVWEIPREGDMRVPARVLASESLLDEISDDRTLQQLKNTTHLPGIQQYALCMPDGHQGYGFPVGGVAAIDAETGCISPGAIGYDINCLTGDTEVRLSHGRKLPIEKLRERFEDERAVVATADDLVDAEIRLFTESGPRTVYAVETETGRTVQATADHPFKTSDGMVAVGDLEPGDSVYVHPFEGVEHEDPAEFTVLARDDVADANPQTVRALEKRGLLPLSSTDEAFHRLLKLVGYLLGDGSCARNGQTWFHGEPEDLNRIREDIRALGFEPSEIYERDRGHEVDGETVEPPAHSCKTTARSLWRVLVELGVPEGPNVASGFTTPGYFDRLADWQKALFCSAYFGAEMTAPATEHDGNLYCPELSQTRTRDTVVDGREFLDDLSEFLDGLGIQTNRAEESEFDSNRDRDTVRLRLGVTDDSESLIRFFTRVGYRYHGEKQREAMKVVQYLRTERREIRSRERIAGEANALADGGTDTAATRSTFDSNDRSDERRPRSGRRRPGFDRPDYEAFREETTVNHDGTLQARVVSVQEVGEKPVYDIGVSHDEHTFLGDGFVVSNCGVRMMKTSLTYDDVRGREAELVDALFANVPTGLGGGGVYEGSNADVEAILERGVDWALEEGFAVQSDRDHCEDGGRRPDADPARVSQKAKDRGRNQVGSLGSGNHFLEVQRVTDVYREDVAGEFGLEDDQIVVLVHCGSRGLGHQVCTDYLREIEQTHAGLLDRLPDRELAAAPAGSQLAEDYYGAMCAAINFAWVNRQLVMHQTREVLGKLFGLETEEMELLYDVAHNIGKKEVHEVGVGPEGRPVGGGDAVDSAKRELYVHRKGATRAFPAGRPELPAAYGDVGQPVIVPGSMGAGSYVLRGGDRSLPETFGSTAHGAGRLMSRTQAKQEFWGGDVQDDLRDQEHVYVKAESGATVAEEAPGVYKDVDEVVRVSDALGIGDRVARTFPVCNIKG
jgi:tRNA-splicing ligase RtcB